MHEFPVPVDLVEWARHITVIEERMVARAGRAGSHARSSGCTRPPCPPPLTPDTRIDGLKPVVRKTRGHGDGVPARGGCGRQGDSENTVNETRPTMPRIDAVDTSRQSSKGLETRCGLAGGRE
jgi:hypothetical protein